MKNNQSPLYTQKRAGTVFSASVILPVLAAFVFAVIIQVIAATVYEARGFESAAKMYADFTGKNWFIYAGFLVSQLAFLAIILGFYIGYEKSPLHLASYKVNKKYIVIGVLLSFGMLFGLSYLNAFFVDFLKYLGVNPPEVSLPVMNNFLQYILAIFVIAVLPALLEEILFRGIILNGIKHIGTFRAALISGALFAIFHQSASQTIYQFINGFVFALIAIRAGSIIPTIIMHFLNNALIITLSYAFPELDYSGALEIILITAALIIFALAMLYLIVFDKSGGEKKSASPKMFLKYCTAGIIISSVMWIAGLFV